MSYRNPVRRIAGGISAAIIMIGLILAFLFGGFNLPIFFIALAVAIFVGSLGSLRPDGIYGGLIGAMWMLMLALFFITGSWLWFMVGVVISILLGTLRRPLMAALLGMGIFGLASLMNQQQQPPVYYQPPTPTPPPAYSNYQEGYQNTQQPSTTYQEGEQNYTYPPTYEQPQAQYPQQMPPQQQ